MLSMPSDRAVHPLRLEILPGTLAAHVDRLVLLEGGPEDGFVQARDLATGAPLRVRLEDLRAQPSRPSAVATLPNHGLRREELCQLKIKDTHPLRGVQHLRVHDKGNKTRDIPLHAGTQELLNALPCQSIRQRAGHIGKPARFYERVQLGGYHQNFECSHVTG